ncbi:hypothetical protein RchiOBHm_Chr5g0003701 [Rosa chinensis]|uniref:Uncharacterized protein n=1 Tax=Rosa chinensis TaxID=74649 RepID=A0A2P6Q2X9_ROSCH|nr:uncharacterized protein LOC112166625 [Rosa chinensis]PRQ28499.1 hypothetical protein RchiOBHm_Chr5g0003701 [Rosa chinensis]
MEYKASTTEAKFPETRKMAARAPVAIGTRGTVGSLVRREIEYFGKLELDRRGSSVKPRGKMVDMSSRNCDSSRPSFWFLRMTWKWKRQRGSRRFLSNICSAAEVVENNRLNGIPGFNYRSLKDDIDNLSI